MSRNNNFDIDKAIENAMEVFWEKGYEGSSMQDLVDVLRLSRSSIYETFGSKKDLYLVALDKYEDQANECLVPILYEKGTAKDLLFRFFNKVIELHIPRSCLMVNASLEMTAHSDVSDRVRSNMSKNERPFYQLLTRALNNGEIKGNPNLRALSEYLVNVMHGISVTAVISDRQTLDNIVSMSLKFLR
ncbi:transcriptional regulator, TetR family [Paenibacillus sp. yr247]|uniref:TetR/AcrR family transcriptional regulator n=1 Tax=Paenibacillus sp. yr247 TaxID=1761880 RepID=UPI0008805C2F|nr:TetR/AcrR family transcriptional regulator [Paenibacillus sp. yr247]SDN04218.1 transcriptional regulator, TetR family [Paenibacillus sp. yr247]